MNKRFVYNHPAIPLEGIITGIDYSLEDLQKKFNSEEIKCFFKEKVESVEEVKKNKQNK